MKADAATQRDEVTQSYRDSPYPREQILTGRSTASPRRIASRRWCGDRPLRWPLPCLEQCERHGEQTRSDKHTEEAERYEPAQYAKEHQGNGHSRTQAHQ